MPRAPGRWRMAQTWFCFGFALFVGSAEVMAEPWRGKSKGASLLQLRVARSRAEHKISNALASTHDTVAEQLLNETLQGLEAP